MATTVREGVPGDAAALARVFHRAARAGWASLFPPGWFEGLESEPDHFAAPLAGVAGMQVLVAAERTRPVGFVLVRPSQDDDAAASTGEVHMLFTDPSLWGAGVGTRLLDAGTAALRERGYAEATLWTAEASERARRLYERAGWRPDGALRERTVRAIRFEELRYRRPLAAGPTPSRP